MLLSAIDLFSGAGGMSEGLMQAGFKVIYSSDINREVALTHVKRLEQLGYVHGKDTCYYIGDIRHISGKEILRSINALELGKQYKAEEIDTLFGGPPCQGFSRAGLRRQDDPRNLLFREYLRIIGEARPKYVVTENVEGFLNFCLDGYSGLNNQVYPTNAPLVEILHEEFRLLGYETLEPKTLDAAVYGVPQHRKRVIFMAYIKGLKPPEYQTPLYVNSGEQVTVRDAISDLVNILPAEPTTPYQLESASGRTPASNGKPVAALFTANHEKSNHNDIVTERFKLYQEGENTTKLLVRLRETGIDIGSIPLLYSEYQRNRGTLNVVTENDVTRDEDLIRYVISKKRSRQKLDMSKPAPTIMTLPDDYIVPFYNRAPSVREMARLQSFDDSFVFYGSRTTGGHRRRIDVPQYSQVGNAVPPLLAKALAESILRCF